MSKNKYQSGSAAIVIVIVLALGLLGTVGYVAWQKFAIVDEPVATETESADVVAAETEETTATSVTETATTTPVVSSSDAPSAEAGVANLTISQWGVKGYYNGSYIVDYELTSADAIKFSTPDSTSQCGGRGLLYLHRYSAGEQIVAFGHLAVDPPMSIESAYAQWSRNSIVKIGSRYYTLDQGVTDVCPGTLSGPGADVETNAIRGIKNFFLTLVAA